MMNLKPETLELIREVEETVSPVYLVGGSVRDLILGKEPKDYDFTTPLSPDTIEAEVKAAGRRAYLTGKKFGTIGFKCRGQFIEVTTFRSEQYTPGSRKPEVEFVEDLKQDLSRRDFTMNAIALRDGELIDPFGGRLDILERKIKAVGEAKDRFKEDPLRMLRAARFAAQLGFEVDPNMIGKIRKMPETIFGISRERWMQEMDKLLMAKHPAYGVSVLLKTNLLRYMLPEVYKVFEQPALQNETIIKLIDASNEDESWAALLSCIGKVFSERKERDFGQAIYPHHQLIAHELATGVAKRLKWSNDRTNNVLEIIKKL